MITSVCKSKQLFPICFSFLIHFTYLQEAEDTIADRRMADDLQTSELEAIEQQIKVLTKCKAEFHVAFIRITS